MIGITRTGRAGAFWTLSVITVLMVPMAPAQRGAPPQNIVVDTTPSHAVSSFSPFRSLGAGIDRLRGGVTDKVMAPEFIQKIQSAGWHTVNWNARSSEGVALASGVYLLRLEAEGVESVQRVVVTR